jgi:hypothetical protein
MKGARECCRQIRRLLLHEYKQQLLLAVSGWFAWGSKKGHLLTEVEKDGKSERLLSSCKQPTNQPKV